MFTIYIRDKNTGELIATHTADTMEHCHLWAMTRYDLDAYNWSYSPDLTDDAF